MVGKKKTMNISIKWCHQIIFLCSVMVFITFRFIFYFLRLFLFCGGGHFYYGVKALWSIGTEVVDKKFLLENG